MLEVPTYQNVNFVNCCKSNMNAIIKACFTNNIFINVSSCKFHGFIIYKNDF